MSQSTFSTGGDMKLIIGNCSDGWVFHLKQGHENELMEPIYVNQEDYDGIADALRQMAPWLGIEVDSYEDY